jgi:hypothetical protein
VGESDAEPITVITPDEPPTLTPAAARLLLRLILSARDGDAERDAQPDEGIQHRRAA